MCRHRHHTGIRHLLSAAIIVAALGVYGGMCGSGCGGALEAYGKQRTLKLKPTKRSVESAAAKVRKEVEAQAMESDSVASKLRISGYDKTSGADRESVFITNNSSHTIHGVGLQIQYIDMKGRQLHKRDVYVKIEVPAGETRRADFRSWDVQKAFHYHLSVASRRITSPYDVRIKVSSAH